MIYTLPVLTHTSVKDGSSDRRGKIAHANFYVPLFSINFYCFTIQQLLLSPQVIITSDAHAAHQCQSCSCTGPVSVDVAGNGGVATCTGGLASCSEGVASCSNVVAPVSGNYLHWIPYHSPVPP